MILMKIVKYLEESGLLIKSVSETIKNEAKEGNLLVGKGSTRAGKDTIRAGEGKIRAGQDF